MYVSLSFGNYLYAQIKYILDLNHINIILSGLKLKLVKSKKKRVSELKFFDFPTNFKV